MRLADIRNIRIFMDLGPDTVSGIFDRQGIASGLDIGLYRIGDIADVIAGLCLLETFIQRFFRDFHEIQDFLLNYKCFL